MKTKVKVIYKANCQLYGHYFNESLKEVGITGFNASVFSDTKSVVKLI